MARTTLPAQQCDKYFSLALGALVLSSVTEKLTPGHPQARVSALDELTYAGGTLITQAGFRREIMTQVNSSINLNAVISLGTSCFGYVFELYKKELDSIGAKSEEIGSAFGLDNLSVQSDFEKQFPAASVHVWNSKPSKYWFSSMVRNAFAHAQWEVIQAVDPKVRLNNQFKGQLTFDVTVTLHDLRIVIYEALSNFIMYVQQDPATWPPTVRSHDPPSHEIMYRILKLEITRLKSKPASVPWSEVRQVSWSYNSEGGMDTKYS